MRREPHDDDDPIEVDFHGLRESLEDIDPSSEARLSRLRMILGVAQELDNTEEIARAALAVANELRRHGRDAERMAELAIDHCRECGRQDGEAMGLTILAELAQERMDLPTAEEHFRNAAECWRMAGEDDMAEAATESLAHVLDMAGEHARALEVLQNGLSPMARTGSVAMQEMRLLWKVGRCNEAIQRADDVFGQMKDAREMWAHPSSVLVYRELSSFLADAGETLRQRNVLQWCLSNLLSEDPCLLVKRGELSLALAKNYSTEGDTASAERWLGQAVPLLGEADRISTLFDALAFALGQDLKVSGRLDTWMGAFGLAGAPGRLAFLGRMLGHFEDDEAAALAALSEGRRRYRENGDRHGESRAWLMQARMMSESPCPGGTDRALRSLSAAMRLGRLSGDLATQQECFLLRSQIHSKCGRLNAAVRAAVRAHELAVKLGDDERLLETSRQLATARLDSGQRDGLAVLLHRARHVLQGWESTIARLLWERSFEDIERRLENPSPQHPMERKGDPS